MGDNLTKTPSAVSFGRETCSDLLSAQSREWVVTNSIGGYAMGTVAGLMTRRYHGYLVAALKPPLGRFLLLSKLEESVLYRGESYSFGVNRWAAKGQPATAGESIGLDVVAPEGLRYLDRFHLEGTTPVWTYAFDNALLKKRLWMQHGSNTTYVQYEIVRASAPLKLRVKALVNYRDHHANTRAEDLEMRVEAVPTGLRIIPPDGQPPFYVLSEDMTYEPEHDWYRDYYLAVEAYRGLNALDDNLYAGFFTATFGVGRSLTIVASTQTRPVLDGSAAMADRRAHEERLLAEAGGLQAAGPGSGVESAIEADVRIQQLVLAADQFVVQRQLPDGQSGHSIIAGYPWFGDWGRDTMISLPGLALATGRHELAKQVLRTYGHFVDRGMIPNRFPDVGDSPEYNTVDATLWFFEAIRATFAATEDEELLEDLFPVLCDIVQWYLKGTRHQIRVDPADGLLRAGEPGVQLTWMDAKVDDWVVTPRIGKPVEVNALWYNALRVMVEVASILGRPSTEYEELASRVRLGFERFWSEELGYCFDVIDGPDGDEACLRPNQLLAVSLHHSPLDLDRQRAVVDVCARSLLTPFGLRSLDPGSPGYTGRHGGGRKVRDAAYHQGTVWGWLIGPFVSAHLRVYGDTKVARAFLLPLLDHLQDGAVGTISEIFDGDAPFAPRGANAQAWSVAEVLRVWEETKPAAQAGHRV